MAPLYELSEVNPLELTNIKQLEIISTLTASNWNTSAHSRPLASRFVFVKTGTQIGG